jgi:hypothetical protein
MMTMVRLDKFIQEYLQGKGAVVKGPEHLAETHKTSARASDLTHVLRESFAESPNRKNA